MSKTTISLFAVITCSALIVSGCNDDSSKKNADESSQQPLETVTITESEPTIESEPTTENEPAKTETQSADKNSGSEKPKLEVENRAESTPPKAEQKKKIPEAPKVKARPINVGGSLSADQDGMDACSLGEVTGLKENGDGFLAVRYAPSTNAEMYGKIHNGQKVWMCESTTDSSWSGVIYTLKDTDCNIQERGKYKGRCHQGWISTKFVKVIAG